MSEIENLIGTDIKLKWENIGGSKLASLDIRNGDLNVIGKSPLITFEEYVTVRRMLLRHDITYMYKGKSLGYWKQLYEKELAEAVTQKVALWLLTPLNEDGFGSRLPYLEDIAYSNDIETIVTTYIHHAISNEPSVEGISYLKVNYTESGESLRIELAIKAKFLDEQFLLTITT